ncbi:MAG: hypothetical protein K2M91_04030, partial [Lachnospiraceae bacterium]|nr:hypothetical protein [Lachnospiraceae bacterium]
MEIGINQEIKLDSNIPFYMVEGFELNWKLNCHALFYIRGYISSNAEYKPETLYGSKIRVWTEKEDSSQIIFCGYVTQSVEENVGNMKKIYIEAQSGTCMLDQEPIARSFQSIEKTYAEIACEAVRDSSGKIICTEGHDRQIGKPLIQYRETTWEFCIRLASHLGSCIIPDIMTGEPALWFGMRNGNDISAFTENEYDVVVKKNEADKAEFCFETESREFYKIGDRTVFCGQKLTICGVSAYFEHGELIFHYQLEQKVTGCMRYQKLFTGLGLAGTVLETRKEQVKVALDIDEKVSTGDYFYNWYPVTGNALYAMPEIGARVTLYFASRDERDGFVLHCIP